MGSWKGRGNQYIQFVSIVYCKLLTNGKQLPASHLRPCGDRTPASEVGGESVKTLPPWPLQEFLKTIKVIYMNQFVSVLSRLACVFHIADEVSAYKVRWKNLKELHTSLNPSAAFYTFEGFELQAAER